MNTKSLCVLVMALSVTSAPAFAQVAAAPSEAKADIPVKVDKTVEADAAAIVETVGRAGRDTTPRSRVATAVKGESAGGLGNVTDHVEVAGGTEISKDKVSVSGSGSVATGNN